jgi:6-phosphofructo-2-kinase / fructose-2,6-biphosphatase 4
MGFHETEHTKILARPELVQLNPGDCDGLKPPEILARWPEEIGRRKKDPYHHRYPRAESYHDLANRLWPVMLEMERETSDLLIIAHESVLRVLCAYFMENSADVCHFMKWVNVANPVHVLSKD